MMNVGGNSLVAMAVDKALNSEFGCTFVYTNCPVVTRHLNAVFGEIDDYSVIGRPVDVSGDETSSEETIKSFLQQVDPNEEIEVLGMMQCTTPFISTEYIDSALEAVESGLYDSALTACDFSRWLGIAEPCVRADTIDPKLNELVSVDWRSQDCVFVPETTRRTARRQDLPARAMENGGIYVASRETWMSGSRYGQNPFIVWMDWYESIEIDTADDLKVANILDDHFFQ